MINRPTSARPAAALILTLAVAAIACGEQQATLPIEPAGPRPATSTTTEPDPAEAVEVVEVPTATPATTEPEAVPEAVSVELPADPGPPEEGTADAQSEVDGVVVMNTWLETTTDPATTEAAHVTTTTVPPAATTTTAAPTTTVAQTTTAAPATTTTTSVVPVTTIAAAPTTTTTSVVPATATTTTGVVTAGGVVVPPIPRPGDPGVPEVNDARQRPVKVDLSWFPEMRNVITYEEWNRVDEENTPWWAQLDEGACGRRWWSYPLTIQVGTVLGNVPNGAYCDKPGVYSYVVTRMWHTPVCDDPDDTDNCIHNETPEANRGVEVWRIVLCGYTFEGSIADFGTSYRAKSIRQPDGRFRVVTNWLFTPSECNR